MDLLALRDAALAISWCRCSYIAAVSIAADNLITFMRVAGNLSSPGGLDRSIEHKTVADDSVMIHIGDNASTETCGMIVGTDNAVLDEAVADYAVAAHTSSDSTPS